MWSGVFPAVTTKFTEDDALDHAEMERCFGLQMDAGCDGMTINWPDWVVNRDSAG